MRTDRFIFDLGFMCFALLLGVAGALQCFCPSKMRALRDQIGPKYNKESPLGQFLNRAHSMEFGVLSRIGGLLLFLGAVLALVSLFRQLTLSR
jgi:hypothetical protein